MSFDLLFCLFGCQLFFYEYLTGWKRSLPGWCYVLLWRTYATEHYLNAIFSEAFMRAVCQCMSVKAKQTTS
jgi:hypothetical protein